MAGGGFAAFASKIQNADEAGPSVTRNLGKIASMVICTRC